MSVKTQFKLMFGYVRLQSEQAWDASETEAFCIAQGDIGRAILYAMEYVGTYEPVRIALALRTFSGDPLIPARTSVSKRYR